MGRSFLSGGALPDSRAAVRRGGFGYIPDFIMVIFWAFM
jgi:hypothetical protein